jgi:hypothetical protein
VWPENEGVNQKWHFDEDMTIRSEMGYVLDVVHGSKINNSTVIAYNKNGRDNQKFRILPVAERFSNTTSVV